MAADQANINKTFGALIKKILEDAIAYSMHETFDHFWPRSARRSLIEYIMYYEGHMWRDTNFTENL